MRLARMQHPEINEKTRIQEDKDLILDRILKNSTYLPESGLVKDLRKALVRLSLSDIRNLDLIIQLNLSEVADMRYGELKIKESK